jgi:hypothetical protein
MVSEVPGVEENDSEEGVGYCSLMYTSKGSVMRPVVPQVEETVTSGTGSRDPIMVTIVPGEAESEWKDGGGDCSLMSTNKGAVMRPVVPQVEETVMSRTGSRAPVMVAKGIEPS